MIGFAQSAVQNKICSKKRIEVGITYDFFLKKEVGEGFPPLKKIQMNYL